MKPWLRACTVRVLTEKLDGGRETGAVPGGTQLLRLNAFVEHPHTLVTAQAGGCRKNAKEGKNNDQYPLGGSNTRGNRLLPFLPTQPSSNTLRKQQLQHLNHLTMLHSCPSEHSQRG